jgi:hypothetical protein
VAYAGVYLVHYWALAYRLLVIQSPRSLEVSLHEL